MNRWLSATAVALLGLSVFAGSASAGDWSGWYVGVNAGGELGSAKWSDIVVVSDPGAGVPGVASTPSGNGFSGGAQVGFDQQMGNWIWGAEFSFNGGGLDAIDETCFGGFGDVHAQCSTRNQWRGDITGKLGMTVTDNSMLYVKAGGSFTDERIKAINLVDFGSPEGSFIPTDQTKFGWTVGTGLEVMLTGDTSVAFEYDYANYGSGTVSMVPPASPPPTFAQEPFTVKVSDQTSQITVRLNFHM